VAVEDYRDDGYLPEALRNYLALLGWSPGGDRELLPLDELVASFRLEDVRSSPAFFDVKKLQAFNAEYIRALPVDEFVDRSEAWLRDRWAPIARLVQERVRTLGDVFPMVDFLYRDDPVFDERDWEKGVRQQPAFARILELAETAFSTVSWDAPSIQQALVGVGEEIGVPLRKVDVPVRLAVTGRSFGPPLFDSLVALGRDRTLKRLQAARARLDGGAGS
jgi:glutamyl-tRNA synthetase